MTLPRHTSDNATQPYAAFMQHFARPPGKLYLLHGSEPAFQLTHRIASFILRRGMPVAVADGGNWFNVHALIESARIAQQNPDRLLSRIHVSRSFTCYQMEQTVTQLLPSFLKSIDSRAAIILGLLDTLYDEQAPLREVRHILQRILAALHAMKAGGASVLVTCLDRSVLPQERNQLLPALARSMDDVYRLEFDKREHPLLIRESPSSLLHPPSSISHPPELSLAKGDRHGTHRTDIYQYHRQRDGRLVEVPPRPSPRRPGNLR